MSLKSKKKYRFSRLTYLPFEKLTGEQPLETYLPLSKQK